MLRSERRQRLFSAALDEIVAGPSFQYEPDDLNSDVRHRRLN